MEVLTELEGESALRLLMLGTGPEDVIAKIIKSRRFYAPAAIRRDIERIRVKEDLRMMKLEDARRNAGEMF